MKTLEPTTKFKKDLKKYKNKPDQLAELKKVLKLLENELPIPAEYKPHQLKGDHKGQWECHIQPNWLMTWEQHDNELMLLFLQTGTHVDLFGW